MTTITNGNYKSTVKLVTDNGYGETEYRVTVLCMTGTHDSGDVCYMKSFATEAAANRAAKRELVKAAS